MVKVNTVTVQISVFYFQILYNIYTLSKCLFGFWHLGMEVFLLNVYWTNERNWLLNLLEVFNMILSPLGRREKLFNCTMHSLTIIIFSILISFLTTNT